MVCNLIMEIHPIDLAKFEPTDVNEPTRASLGGLGKKCQEVGSQAVLVSSSSLSVHVEILLPTFHTWGSEVPSWALTLLALNTGSVMLCLLPPLVLGPRSVYPVMGCSRLHLPCWTAAWGLSPPVPHTSLAEVAYTGAVFRSEVSSVLSPSLVFAATLHLSQAPPLLLHSP